MTVEERLEVLAKQMHEMSVSNQELKAKNEYFRKQLGNNMKQKQKLQEPSVRIGEPSARFGGVSYGNEEEGSNALSCSEDEIPYARYSRESRPAFNTSEFKVTIPEFEGKLDPDEFIEWLQTMERIFEF